MGTGWPSLAEMTRPPDTTLSSDVAREVCERSGSKAYIVGSIANLGGEYVLGLNAVNCTTGENLGREQIQVTGKQQATREHRSKSTRQARRIS